MMKFFVRLAKSYEEFCFEEVEFLISDSNSQCNIIHKNVSDGYYILQCRDIGIIDFLLERSVFIKEASFLDFLYLQDYYRHFNINENASTRMTVLTINKQINLNEKNEIIQKNIHFIDGYKINLKSPNHVYQIVWTSTNLYNTIIYKKSNRKKILKYDAKNRPFIGITCMDWEVSIFMCNAANIKRDSLVIDPFIGSGGIAMACCMFNSCVIGIEHDIKMLYGQNERRGNVKTSLKGTSIFDNFRFINKESNVAAIINASSFDLKLKCQFDAVITDPPYGDKISLNGNDPLNYIIFLKLLCDNNLKTSGRICFFFPNTFHSSVLRIFSSYKQKAVITQVLRSVTRILYVFEKI